MSTTSPLVSPHLNYSLISCMAHLHCYAKCAVSKFQRVQIYKCCHLGRSAPNLPISPHSYHTHSSHPLFNLLQTGLAKTPLAVSSSSPSGTVLWTADRYWWLLRQTPCQALNTQCLMYDLLPAESNQTTLPSRLVLHFYTITLGKSVS